MHCTLLDTECFVSSGHIVPASIQILIKKSWFGFIWLRTFMKQSPSTPKHSCECKSMNVQLKARDALFAPHVVKGLLTLQTLRFAIRLNAFEDELCARTLSTLLPLWPNQDSTSPGLPDWAINSQIGLLLFQLVPKFCWLHGYFQVTFSLKTCPPFRVDPLSHKLVTRHQKPPR